MAAKRQDVVVQRAVTLWTARAIPLILIGIVGYATYVFVVRLCIHYLLFSATHASQPAAIALLTVYFIVLLPMAITYARLLFIVQFKTGYMPLGPGAKQLERRRTDKSSNEKNSGPLTSELRGGADSTIRGPEYADASSSEQEAKREPFDGGPGSNMSEEAEKALEAFWKKDVFVCMNDGRPKWCSECAVWKPDRTHHCSDVGRCVEKMDHFCPWVGGVVAQNSFKFFLQFVTYTWVYCFYVMAVTAVYVKEQVTTSDVSLDAHFAVIIGIAGFFGLFTLGMSGSSAHFAITNLTTIENLNRKSKVWTLAIHIPSSASARLTQIRESMPTVTYPVLPSSYNYGVADVPNPTSTYVNGQCGREFAIVNLEMGESPWDLGSFMKNWKTVMGENVFEWLLPLKRSPCCRHDDISQFALGPAVHRARERMGIV